MGAILAALLELGSVGGMALQISNSTETWVGVQAPAQFLTHWQQVGSETGVIPTLVPVLWSGVAGSPSRLPRTSGTARIDTVTAGDVAMVWVFHETAGIVPSTEIEISFQVQYQVGSASASRSTTVYIETQARAPAGTVTYTIYWDTGQRNGVTFVNQLEVAQACVAIGSCP